MGLIKDTLIPVVRARKGTLDKANGARRGRKEGTVKGTLLPTGDREGIQNVLEREEAGVWLKNCVQTPSAFQLLSTVARG